MDGAARYTRAVPAPNTAVTRDDVARLAGVSAATVSYVLNNGPRGVSEDKRRRVLDAVQALGYRPNAIARSLRARRTNIIGLVLPDSANPYFASLARAIEAAAAAQGFLVIVASAADDPRREAEQLEALLRLQVDGMLWVPADVMGTAPAPVQPAAVPVVQVDRAWDDATDGGPLHNILLSDNRAGGYLAAEHLVQLGHRRIACLAGPATHRHAQLRLEGVQECLAAAGLILPPALVAHGTWDYAAGADLVAGWAALPAHERPTAIICGNDAMAIGAIAGLAAAGLAVPADMSVMGYDDIPQARYMVPSLSTIAQPFNEIGREAVRLLLGRVAAAQERPVRRMLPVRLVRRESTASPGPGSHARHARQDHHDRRLSGPAIRAESVPAITQHPSVPEDSSSL